LIPSTPTKKFPNFGIRELWFIFFSNPFCAIQEFVENRKFCSPHLSTFPPTAALPCHHFLFGRDRSEHSFNIAFPILFFPQDPPLPWPRLSGALRPAQAELTATSYPRQEKLHRAVHLVPSLRVLDDVSAPNRPCTPMLSHRCGATAPPPAASHGAEHEPSRVTSSASSSPSTRACHAVLHTR
jgi:hypothetical protein